MGSISKILVPVDNSSYSEVALQAAQNIAKAFNASLYVHHVSENSSSTDEIRTKAKNILNDLPHTLALGEVLAVAQAPGDVGGVAGHQNASAGRAIISSDPVFSLARCAPVSGSSRSTK